MEGLIMEHVLWQIRYANINKLEVYDHVKVCKRSKLMNEMNRYSEQESRLDYHGKCRHYQQPQPP